jgi:hypothetical protein
MNRKANFAITLSLLAAISTVGAQAPAPATQPPASSVQAPAPAASPPRLEMKAPARANREPSVTADARGCLELSSNDAIIRCAEKYLPHRRTG